MPYTRTTTTTTTNGNNSDMRQIWMNCFCKRCVKAAAPKESGENRSFSLVSSLCTRDARVSCSSFLKESFWKKRRGFFLEETFKYTSPPPHTYSGQIGWKHVCVMCTMTVCIHAYSLPPPRIPPQNVHVSVNVSPKSRIKNFQITFSLSFSCL